MKINLGRACPFSSSFCSKMILLFFIHEENYMLFQTHIMTEPINCEPEITVITSYSCWNVECIADPTYIVQSRAIHCCWLINQLQCACSTNYRNKYTSVLSEKTDWDVNDFSNTREFRSYLYPYIFGQRIRGHSKVLGETLHVSV